MSSLVDHQIDALARHHRLIEPYCFDQVNPGSYDVLLGNTILVEDPCNSCYYETKESKRWIEVDISDRPYFLKPGQFILGHTQEFVRIPDNLEAVFCLKSSRGREGWNHALAAYIDPGFQGRITLELKNYNQHQMLKAVAGMRIGQLRFTTMDSEPLRSYGKTGRYQGDLSVQASRG